MTKISCIIPAYNEAPRIGAVIDAVHGHHQLDEIIVIDDGSKDNTAEILQFDHRIKFVTYSPNKGKTNAVLTGLEMAKNDLVMMLDSDLIGLTKEDITELITPVINDEADVTISLRGNSLDIYKKLKIDIFSGERVFDKKLILDYKEELSKLKGFGLETFMNSVITKKKLRIKVVGWPKVSHARKQEKIGKFKGLVAELRMTAHVLKTVNVITLTKLLRDMKKLMVK